MRSLARVYSDMHSQCAPLDEGLGAVGTFEGAFICMNALVPREVRSTAKRLFRISNPMEKKESEYIPLYSLPNYREKVVSLADWDAPYRSAQECPFVYGMLEAGACQTRDRVRGNLLTAGGEKKMLELNSKSIEQSNKGTPDNLQKPKYYY